MNFNTSPIAFFPSRAAQIWRAWFAQRKISVICGNDLLPFYIIDNGNAPTGGELYDPNTDTKVDDIDFAGHLLDHDITVDGQSAHIWIYQGEMAGVFGRTNPGYYYLKIGNWYSDVFRIGALSSEYTEINWQFYDDIITADGTPISKHIKYRQIFETPLWHPEYNIEEEGKTNNGIFYAMQQTTKKTSGFNAIVNESQIDCLNLTRMADNITVKACLNGTVKTMQTNQFEISSKWESDDVASIECKFDLFAIIRKYQQSNVEPEPLPITPPEPPVTDYYISGTVNPSANNVTITLNGTPQTFPVYSGGLLISYNTPLSGECAFDDGNILTLDFTRSCGLGSVTKCKINGSNINSVNLSRVTFAALTETAQMFENTNISTLSIPDATFASVTGSAERMFRNCNQLKTINIAQNIPANNYNAMFENCAVLQSVNMPNQTFAGATDFSRMFASAKVDGTFTFSASATLSSATNCAGMFAGSKGNINIKNIFANAAIAPTKIYDTATIGGLFDGSNATTINVDGFDFSGVVNFARAFANCANLTTISNFDDSCLNSATVVQEMFSSTPKLNIGNILTTATFAAATNANGLFMNGGTNIVLPNAVFGNVTNARQMFYGSKATNIELPVATFAAFASSDIDNWFGACDNLTTVKMQSATLAALRRRTMGYEWFYYERGAHYTASTKLTTFVGSGCQAFNESLTAGSTVLSAQSIIELAGMVKSGGDLYILNACWNALTPTEQGNVTTAATALGVTIRRINL